MAEETPYRRFTDALDSIKDIVRNELALVELDARLAANLGELSDEDFREKRKLNDLTTEEQPIFAAADKTKEEFLTVLRSDLEGIILKFANARRDSWKAIKQARADKLGKETEKLKSAVAAESERLRSGTGTALAAGRQSVCPPGFIEVDGICVPI